ncbi:MAG TPA: VWA domain-containing protein [Polyangiaceae bacterium]|nr:VWA domain-containing protein [Polyangiaceae bacterium]
MTDPRAVLRVLDELVWAMRREGVAIAPSQAIDAVRAVAAVGLERPAQVREALAAVLVARAGDRDAFDAAFDRFFAPDEAARRARTLWERLAERGFDGGELASLRAALDELSPGPDDPSAALGALLGAGADLDRALAMAGVARRLDAHSGPQIGFVAHRVLSRVGSGGARRALASLRRRLVETLGARGAALADALAQELERAEGDVRAWVRETQRRRALEHERLRAERRLATTPFSALSDAEIEEVRRAVRRFAERLRAGARVRRRRRSQGGRIDPHRTIRRALRTAGVPLDPARKRTRRDRPRLVLLCDVSESVRAAACFLLELTYAVQELFERARSFVFVSELAEATELFAREPVRAAIARAWGGELVGTGDNSNYGRVLRAFEARHGRELDGRTTLVVLGDGRTNYHDAGADVLDRLRARCRAIVWLCPEPRGQWAQGDSAMPLYASKCTSVHEVSCAADLERAARAVVSRRWRATGPGQSASVGG